MLFIFQEEVSDSWLSSFFRFFIDPNYLDAPGSEMAASNWVFTALVVAVLVAGLMEVVKWVRKERASINRKHWPLRSVFGWIALGFLPILIFVLAFYLTDNSFKQVLGWGGFFKGVVFGWLIYVVVMIVVDICVPRFRSDYGK